MKLINNLTLCISLSSIPCIVTAAPAEAKHYTSYSTSCSKSYSTSGFTAHSTSPSTSRCTSYSISTSKTKRHSTTATSSLSTTQSTVIPTSSTTQSTITPTSSATKPTAPTATSVPYVDGRLFNIDGKTQYFAGTTEADTAIDLYANKVERY